MLGVSALKIGGHLNIVIAGRAGGQINRLFRLKHAHFQTNPMRAYPRPAY